MNQQFEEGVDYYFDSNGLFVLTERYLMQRGFCCGNGCRHCPYNYLNVPEPRRTELLNKQKNEKENH
ncbi:MAG TPA: DUF5522 domain-containing protein [Puia sp.]|nr:DUF5522 domain-containing protein [Puia sp.]